MNALRRVRRLLQDSLRGLSEDQVPMMGAALAYYTVFSIAPLLIIAIGVAGLAFGRSAGTHVFDAIRGVVGPSGAAAIESMVRAASSRPHAGAIATLLGVATLLVGASGVFQQLQQSLNVIWKVTPGPRTGWEGFVRQRLLSFAMVAAIGFLLLVSMVISAVLAAAGKWARGALPGGAVAWHAVNAVVSLGVFTGVFSAVQKLLPDVRLRWRDVGAGGVFTAVLFVIGKEAIGFYLGRSAVASSYGAAGSLIVILLWVYYSAQIFLFGAEFTRAWATRDGRAVPPKAGAVVTLSPLQAAERAGSRARASEREQARGGAVTRR